MGKSRTISNLPNVTTNSLTEKLVLVDADLIRVSDSAASFAEKKTPWSNIKSVLKTYFDTLYMALTGNQTIAGVKTFSSSPIVPTPTTTGQSTPKDYVDGVAYGINQQYVDMTASRALSTDYTNTTGKTIQVKFKSVDFTNGVKSATATITYPDTTSVTFPIAKVSTSATVVLFGTFEVSPAAVYSIDSDLAILSWWELR